MSSATCKPLSPRSKLPPLLPRRSSAHALTLATAAKHPKLKERTLTNLSNERPTWLRLTHLALDRAVLNAYAATDPNPAAGWTPAWTEALEPTGAGQPLPEGHPLTQRLAETEQSILAALLRLNHARAAGR